MNTPEDFRDALKDDFGLKSLQNPSCNIVITGSGLKLSLSDIEFVQYLRFLATQRQVNCTCTVLNDNDFIFSVSYDCKK